MKCTRKKNFGPLSRSSRVSSLSIIRTYVYTFFRLLPRLPLPSLPLPFQRFFSRVKVQRSKTRADEKRRKTRNVRVSGSGIHSVGDGVRARPTHGHTYIHRLPSILGEFTKALVARLIVTGLVSISRTYVARVQLDVG